MARADSDIRLGIVGVSHGHPYAIASFFNGYDLDGLRRAYPNIGAYLESAPPELRRLEGARVECIWAEERKLAEHVASIGRIPNVADRPEDVVERVDAVLVTGDDGNRRLAETASVIAHKRPLFVDRPLGCRWEDVRELWRRTGPDYPILSCSNLRYNPELDRLRAGPAHIGEPVLLRALSAMDWAGYGWHLAETLVALWGRDASTVQLVAGSGDCGRVVWRDGAGHPHEIQAGDWTVEVRYGARRRALLQVLHPMAKTVAISLHGMAGHAEVPIADPFTMMRRLLLDLLDMIRSGRQPARVMDDTLAVSRIITGARASLARGGTRVALEELTV
jgi:hypothetical protein